MRVYNDEVYLIRKIYKYLPAYVKYGVIMINITYICIFMHIGTKDYIDQKSHNKCTKSEHVFRKRAIG